jgi:hypothetical protein
MIANATFVRRTSIAMAAGLLLATSACSIQVDPTKDGKQESVKVQTPFGGVHVNTNDMAASDTGLPAYPGATAMAAKDKNGKHDQNADIDIHFGAWQVRVKVLKYHTPDSQDKVMVFYRKALGRYGDVIECHGDEAVGTPTVTRQGLGCKDDTNSHRNNIDMKSDSGVTLKAGSHRHQHIMGIDKSDIDGTDFALVALDLPAENVDLSKDNDEQRETN